MLAYQMVIGNLDVIMGRRYSGECLPFHLGQMER